MEQESKTIEKPKFSLGGIFKSVIDFATKYQNIIIVLLIVGLALFLRVWQISTLPPGFSAKELPIVREIQHLKLSNMWLGGNYYQAAYIYPAYLFTKIFGLTVTNLRIFSAIIGTATIYLTYVFIAKWFSQKIAIFTAFLFAISAFHITVSRLIVAEITLPLILLGLFVTLTEAYRTKNIWLFGLSGLLAAAGLYTSPAFLMVPIIFLISGIYFFNKNKKFVHAYRQELIIAAIAFAAAALPYVVSFIQHPASYMAYYNFNKSITQIVINLSQIPYMLILGTPLNFFFNLGTEPLVDPFISVTAIFGIVIAVISASRRKYFFLLTWLGFFVLYASFKSGVQILDLMGILAVIYAFAALALDFVIDKWFKTFPLNKRVQLLAIGVIAIFFALSALYNFDRYFVGYKNSKFVKKEFSVVPPIPQR